MAARLVCAIDGENVSFATVAGDADARLDGIRQFRTSDFPTFTDALQAYTRDRGLSTAGLPLGLAVAGVTGGSVISLANCRWYISVAGLRAFLGREPLVINDFEAIAWAIAQADPASLRRIGALPPRPATPGCRFLIVGTGPGLGMATLLIGEGGTVTVVAGEGGHSSFAPQSAQEDALLLRLRARFGHVSFERLLAAAGLQNIHAAIAEEKGRAAPPPSAELIIAEAQRGEPVAAEAAALFASILGAFTGNMVLCTAAFDGVYLVSPMISALIPQIERGGFRNAMIGKGRMRKALEQVPVSFAGEQHSRLIGAAAALHARKPQIGAEPAAPRPAA